MKTENMKDLKRRCAAKPNELWAWGFFYDRLADCRSIKAQDAVAMLKAAFAKHGNPQHLYSNNGPEFIAKALRKFLAGANVETLYIEPGAPWQNGFVESFNSRVKAERVGVEEFTSLLKAQVIGGDWKEAYNTRRPHSTLDNLTSERFAESYKQPKSVGWEDRPGANQRPPFRSTVIGTNNLETLIAAGP